MNSERVGEQVFTNIDEALAEKIISRSKENAGDRRRGSGSGDRGSRNRVDVSGDPRSGPDPRRDPASDGVVNTSCPAFGRLPLIGLIAAAVTLFIVVKLIFSRGNGRGVL